MSAHVVVARSTLQRLAPHPDWRLEVADGELVARLRPRPLHLWRPTGLPTPSPSRPHTVVLLDGRRDRSRLPDLIRELWVDLPPYRHLSAPERRQRLDHDLRVTLAQSLDGPLGAVALDDTGPTGVALLSHPWTEGSAAAGVPTMSWLAVRAERRRQGIGTLLLRAVASHLEDLGVEWVTSPLPLADGRALCWHLANGFGLPPPPAQ